MRPEYRNEGPSVGREPGRARYRRGGMGRRLRIASGALILAVIAACEPAGDPTPPPLSGARIIGCIGIDESTRSTVDDSVVKALPAERGIPASMQIQLIACDPPACDPTQMHGQATFEWADGGEPLLLRFDGPRDRPTLAFVNDAIWSGLMTPTSKRVAPGVVVPFTLGHCGLLHVVDFDGSFWVPVGFLGDDPATMNAAAGQMQLIGPDRAQFASGGKVIATLARFPGPKHFWLCA